MDTGAKQLLAGKLGHWTVARLFGLVFAAAVLTGPEIAAAQVLVFDRGLPTAGINTPPVANRSNVLWLDTETTPDSPWRPGDDFMLAPGSYAVKTNKTVVVRGKVVKFTPGVMGKNWVHIRDGSGSAADNSNDVLVTTKDETKIGDVVLVKGVVQTDVDLGSGYAYKVLVGEATLQK